MLIGLNLFKILNDNACLLIIREKCRTQTGVINTVTVHYYFIRSNKKYDVYFKLMLAVDPRFCVEFKSDVVGHEMVSFIYSKNDISIPTSPL